MPRSSDSESASGSFSCRRSGRDYRRSGAGTSSSSSSYRRTQECYESITSLNFRSGQCLSIALKIDHSMARRMKEKRGPELTKVTQKEKILTSMQFKLLDISRPLLFISDSVAADKTNVNLDRRENILKFTDLRFESLLNEPEHFNPDVSEELFGRSFLRSMVEDADNDAKLRIVNRTSNCGQRQSGHSGPSDNSHHHLFSNKFSGKGYVNPCASLVKDSDYFGGWVRFSADFRPTLTKEQWVIRSVSNGVRIPFNSIPSVPFAQSNMGMSAELEAICDAEVQSLLQKKAIEIVPETELCFAHQRARAHGSSSRPRIVRPWSNENLNPHNDGQCDGCQLCQQRRWNQVCKV
ncbi:hypothetical protein GHT06_020399 [Daphnia sinensis]|uniref:Uncharacterized protein n=1 Tax=Daphnia sinensis TaxID=1820382 RepID=A0AAD5KHN9_9CRUS|nr:hypothetical protein GHT06_020399 [Daphnia sinensis]